MSDQPLVFVSWDQIYRQGGSVQASVDEMDGFSSLLSSLGGSPESSSMSLANAPNASAPQPTRTYPCPHVDISQLYQRLPSIYHCLRNNPDLYYRLQSAVGHLSQNVWPGDESFQGFVKERDGKYYCVLPDCKRYSIGWDREDRAQDHFIMSHIGRVYKCPQWCDYLHLAYTMLTKLLRSPQTCKRLQDLKVHTASHGPVSGFTCHVW